MLGETCKKDMVGTFKGMPAWMLVCIRVLRFHRNWILSKSFERPAISTGKSPLVVDPDT